MIRAIVLTGALVLAGGCAGIDNTQRPVHTSYAKDIRIGLEAESIGNWSLAQAFLEKALRKDDAHLKLSVFDDERYIDKETREEAKRALTRVYFEKKELDLLFEHLHRYWQVTDFESGEWVPEEVEQHHLSYHLRWYCRLLDDNNRFSDAQACWAKLGENSKARASIRAFELQEVFGQ